MAVNGYRKKVRGVETRKRKRFVFISAEGNNKTETMYLKSFNDRNIQIKPVTGKTTDPVKMSQDLIKKMREVGFDVELGDLAYCFVDGDFESYKDRQVQEADLLAKKNNFRIIMSNPCFEIW